MESLLEFQRKYRSMYIHTFLYTSIYVHMYIHEFGIFLCVCVCVCVCVSSIPLTDGLDEYYREAAAGRIKPPCCLLYIVSIIYTLSLYIQACVYIHVPLYTCDCLMLSR